MRLVRPSGAGRVTIGQEAFAQLRDVGERLEYIVERYRRIVGDVADGRPLPDVRDGIELMNSQLGYVARRLQELMLARRDDSSESAGEQVAV